MFIKVRMDQQLNVKRLHLKYLRGLEARQEAELRNTKVSFKTWRR